MLIKYAGSRPHISTCLSRRGQYYFGPENGYILDVTDPDHIRQLLKSTQHRFEVVTKAEEPKKEEPKKEEPKEEKPKEEPKKEEKEKSKGGRGKKNA